MSGSSFLCTNLSRPLPPILMKLEKKEKLRLPFGRSWSPCFVQKQTCPLCPIWFPCTVSIFVLNDFCVSSMHVNSVSTFIWKRVSIYFPNSVCDETSNTLTWVLSEKFLCRVAFECCQGSVYLLPRDPRSIVLLVIFLQVSGMWVVILTMWLWTSIWNK